MRKAIILLFFSLYLGGCAIEGEVFRLQQRMKTWNILLPDEQLQLFAKNDTNSLGAWLDSQEAADAEFATKLKELRENEAIMAFNGTQTAHFFYNTLLKDLAKFSYAEFIKNISAKDFQGFVSSSDGSALLSHPKTKLMAEHARDLYGMTKFSNEDVLRFHRQKSFPAHLYIVVYDTLAFAAKNNAFNDILNNNYTALDKFLTEMKKNRKSRRPTVRNKAEKSLNEWNYIYSRAQVPDMPVADFLKLVVESVLPEMDEDVRAQTLNNIKERFGIN